MHVLRHDSTRPPGTTVSVARSPSAPSVAGNRRCGQGSGRASTRPFAVWNELNPTRTPGWTTARGGCRAQIGPSKSCSATSPGARGVGECTTRSLTSRGSLPGRRSTTQPGLAPMARGGSCVAVYALRRAIRLGGNESLPRRGRQRRLAPRPHTPRDRRSPRRPRVARTATHLLATPARRWKVALVQARPGRPPGHGWPDPAPIRAQRSKGKGVRPSDEHRLQTRRRLTEDDHRYGRGSNFRGYTDWGRRDSTVTNWVTRDPSDVQLSTFAAMFNGAVRVRSTTPAHIPMKPTAASVSFTRRQ